MVAVVKDLFFVARIRETARLAGVPLAFARTPEEAARALDAAPRFALVDLTSGLDLDPLLGVFERSSVPVVGYTTHAAARETQPWHGRCRRVMTKEALTRELPELLAGGPGE